MSTPENQPPSTPSPVGEMRLQANAVVDRLRFAWRVETDAALAECLKTSRQTVSKWRSRNSVPFQEAVYTAEQMAISLDWIIRGDVNGSFPQALGTVDVKILSAIFVHLWKVGYIKLKEGQEEAVIDFIAKSTGEVYLRAKKTIELLQRDDHLSEVDATRVAIATVNIIGPTKRP